MSLIVGLVVKAGDWLVSSKLGRWILLAIAGLIGALLWRRSIVNDTRRELELQAERRAAEAQRRMQDARDQAPRTDAELLDRLDHGRL